MRARRRKSFFAQSRKGAKKGNAVCWRPNGHGFDGLGRVQAEEINAIR
jgi:hypothetical protein